MAPVNFGEIIKASLKALTIISLFVKDFLRIVWVIVHLMVAGY